MKKRNRILIGGWNGVSGATITPTIPPDSRLRELWFEFSGDAAAGVTPSFDAMGQILIKQTGPGNAGQLVQADTLAALVLQQNRRGGIVDSVYAAGAAGNFSSICAFYAYEDGDRNNCLHFHVGQGLNIQFGGTAGGAAVWDSLIVEVYAILADDQDCMQFYIPYTSQRQVTLGGTVPIELENNLLEFCVTQSSTGAANNPTNIQLLSGTTVEDEGSFEGLKRQANSEYPIEATQTTLMSTLHGRFEKPIDALEMVRSGVTLRLVAGSGTTQLFQRFLDFNEDSTALSYKKVEQIRNAKRAKLLASSSLSSGMKQLALPALSPSQAKTYVSQAATAQIEKTYAPITRAAGQPFSARIGG
jgi:hypothetical protein